jgi:hypothetical protein
VAASLSSSLSFYPSLDGVSGGSLNNRARGKTGLQSTWNRNYSISSNFCAQLGNKDRLAEFYMQGGEFAALKSRDMSIERLVQHDSLSNIGICHRGPPRV